MAVEGSFTEPQLAPASVGLLIAPVYRFRVTNIPFEPGREVFPTVEIIDRTYPPPQLAWKFPIPIELTQEDLRIALSGKMVTRVIYVEDPNTALPVQTENNEQAWFDVGPEANPLFVADTLGRPVAILRMGGRQPMDPLTPSMTFLLGCPPLMFAPQCVDVSDVGTVPEEIDPRTPAPLEIEELETPAVPDDSQDRSAAAEVEVRG